MSGRKSDSSSKPSNATDNTSSNNPDSSSGKPQQSPLNPKVDTTSVVIKNYIRVGSEEDEK